MTDDRLDALRAVAARQAGDTRTFALIRLGRTLLETYWRIGPGQSAGRRYVDEAVQVLGEAYHRTAAGEPLRGQVAANLGWLLSSRHVVHGGSDEDLDRGVALLDEALSLPDLPQAMQDIARLSLGQLLICRATRSMQSRDFVTHAMRSGLPREDVSSADRAVVCFQQVVDSPSASPETRSLARTMLRMAESVKTLSEVFEVGPGHMDLGRMTQAMQALQESQRDLEQRHATGQTGSGFGHMPDVLGFADHLPSEATPVPATALRATLRDTLPGEGFAGVLALLEEDAAIPPVDVVDTLVALGSSLTESPDADGIDRLLFAVALYLRGRVGGGGWGVDDDSADDFHAAADSLEDAADGLIATPSDAVALALRLADCLDERLPGRDVRGRVSERSGWRRRVLRRRPGAQPD